MKLPALIIILAFFVGIPVLDAKEASDPIFVRWMSPTRATDQTILAYWDQVQKDKISSKSLIDLGTMLFRRGFPNDALDMYELALEKNENNPEAWYRIGLVEHQKGNLRPARKAYKNCLKQMSGHGWCNFYLGLLEEGEGNADKALKHYTKAFQHAPELVDPEINPEVLYSKLYVGALVKHTEESRFARAMPMPFLEPGKVQGTNRRIKSSIDAEKNTSEPAKRLTKKEIAQPETTAKSAQDSETKPKIGSTAKVSPQRRRPRPLRVAPTPTPTPEATEEPPPKQPSKDPKAG